jgi:fumarylacetoacetate (FAA) hydrolase
MKLASLKDGRDGRLVVVSKGLSRCSSAAAVAPTLQTALDDWDAAMPGLTEIVDALEAGGAAHLHSIPVPVGNQILLY